MLGKRRAVRIKYHERFIFALMNKIKNHRHECQIQIKREYEAIVGWKIIELSLEKS